MKRFLFILPLMLCFGCTLFQPTAYFFISNTSNEKTPVDIQVRIGNETVFDDSINYSDIAPDLQYTPSLTLPTGKYMISVTADSGKAVVKRPISLGSDRWIFVSYHFSKPVDSLEKEEILKQFPHDTVFLQETIRGRSSGLRIHIMDKQPIHL